MQTASEQCPWCGSNISRARFEEIAARIRGEEQEKLQQRETEIRTQCEAQYRRQLVQEKKTAVDAEKALTERKITELTGKLSKLQGQEAQLKTQLRAQAEKDLKKQLAEQRQILERSHNQTVLKKQSEFGRERERWHKKIGELERQLQNKTSNELGDGAEIDLFEVLRETFPDDRFKRVPKGEPGADIHQHVVYKGQACGLIVFDSKNRQSWQRTFAAKLHDDQLAANADHAILSTTVFPSGKKELCVEAGVIVVNPARAPHIVTLLRNALVKMHIRGLSVMERQEKVDRLYRLITSEQYTQRFSEAANLTKRILEVDVQEQDAHRNVWKKRGQLATRLQTVLNELDGEVAAIVEGAREPAEEAACPF